MKRHWQTDRMADTEQNKWFEMLCWIFLFTFAQLTLLLSFLLFFKCLLNQSRLTVDPSLPYFIFSSSSFPRISFLINLTGPYEILVRELVAVDGADSSEILLIDSQGCPTDSSIMGAVSRTNGNGQALEVPFDAFKFPSSDVVQFRALVTPCVPSCEPVVCDIKGYDGKKKEVTSYGRRKRSTVDGNGSTFHSTMPRTRLGPRSSLQHSPARTFSTTTAPPSSSKSPDEEMVVVKTIKIHDSFDFPKGSGRKDSIISKNSRPEIVVEGEYYTIITHLLFHSIMSIIPSFLSIFLSSCRTPPISPFVPWI